MDSPRDGSGSGSRRDASSDSAGAGGREQPRPPLTLEYRVILLEHTNAELEHRLRAIEQRMGSAVALAPPPLPPVGAVAAEGKPEAAPPALHAPLYQQPAPSLEAPAPQAAKGARRAAERRSRRAATRLSLAELERAMSGRILAWAGGLTLLLGAVFFLSLAMTRGWIGIEARLVIGLVAGIVVTALGDRLIRNGDRVLGPVLVAVGIGIWNLTLVAGTRRYEFIPIWLALLGAVAGAVAAIGFAIRTNAQVIAAFGVVTALAAPMLFAVPSNDMPMAYLVIVLAGSTAIAFIKGWSWLPPVAFVITGVQFYAWWPVQRLYSYAARDAQKPLAEIILVIAGITLCTAIGAVGMTRAARSRRGSIAAAVLLALNAYSFGFVGFIAPSSTFGIGIYLLAGACAHAAIGAFVVRRQLRVSGFAYTAFALAGVLLAGATTFLLPDSLVAIAFAAEAVVLVWLARSFRNAGALVGAALFAAFSIAHLLYVEFPMPLSGVETPHAAGLPFLHSSGLTLLVWLALLALAGWIAQSHVVRVAIAITGFLVLLMILPRELAGLPLLAGWAVLAVLALAIDRLLAASGEADAPPDDLALAWCVTNGLSLTAAAAAALAIARAVGFEMPVFVKLPFVAGEVYIGQPVAATTIIVLAAFAAAVVTRTDVVRQIAGAAAILITAHLAAFMLTPAQAVACWALLAVAAIVLHGRESGAYSVFSLTGGVLLATGVVVTLTRVAPTSRLFVTAGSEINHPVLWSEATLALGALVAALCFVAWTMRGTPLGAGLANCAGALAVYLLSVGIVDAFQAQLSDAAGVTELRRQSQVALSVVWGVLGGGAVLAGLTRHVAGLRWFGIGLLALATLKVFLYDLSSLEAIYRVMSFLVLGVLLLLCSYAYRRFGAGADDDSTPADATR